MFDALIIGGGPAGVSCALWLKQLGFKPALVEKRDRCGGLQLANPYTNTWIATSVNVHGADVANAMHENMLKHGVPLYLGQAARSASLAEDAITVTTSEDVDISAKYLVLAGGVTPKSGGFASRLGLIVGPGAQVASANVDGARVAILGGVIVHAGPIAGSDRSDYCGGWRAALGATSSGCCFQGVNDGKVDSHAWSALVRGDRHT